jgi:hypothetical protein
MIELEHSPLGGSAAHRFHDLCRLFPQHRAQLEDGTFENVESEYAKLGTGAHELGAKAIATGDASPSNFSARIQRLSRRLARWHFAGRGEHLFQRVHGVLARRKEQAAYMLLEDDNSFAGNPPAATRHGRFRFLVMVGRPGPDRL